MLNPPHPGEGLKDDFEALGLSTTEAAKALGISRQQLRRVLSGASGISVEMALRLETVIGPSADHWMRLQAAYEIAQTRKQDTSITKGLARLQMNNLVGGHVQ